MGERGWMVGLTWRDGRSSLMEHIFVEGINTKTGGIFERKGYQKKNYREILSNKPLRQR